MTVANWQTSYNELNWQYMKSVGTLEKRSKGQPYDLLSTTAILPSARGDSIVFVNCHEHIEKKTKKKWLHWVLIITSRPPTLPPKSVVAGTKKVGGIEGLFKFLEKISDPLDPPTAYMDMEVIIPEDGQWSCKLLSVPIALPPVIAELGHNPQLANIGYHFEEGQGGAKELSVLYDRDEKAFNLKVSAIGLLKLSLNQDLHISTVDQLTEFLLSRIFEKHTISNA